MSDIVKRVQELLKLPQSLCKMCGLCCRVATFKGGLSYENVLKLSKDKDAEPSQVEGAIDFLSIFVPYDSVEEARKVSSDFIDVSYEIFGKNSDVAFFHCRYINENNHCLIHEDRPLLCRMYPIPHERTFYNPGCGFKEQGEKNWQEINNIIENLKKKQTEINSNMNNMGK